MTKHSTWDTEGDGAGISGADLKREYIECIYCVYSKPNPCAVCNGTKKDYIHAHLVEPSRRRRDGEG
jgi:hypothetical protein